MTSIRSDRLTDKYIDKPLTEGVILRRDETGTVYTNVPHVALYHSPDGYEFGYPGSGLPIWR